MKSISLISVLTFIWLTASALEKSAASEPGPTTIAVFNFESSDEVVHDLGPKVSALINAELSVDPRMITVERAELDKVLGEQELGLSGTIKAETAAKIGHLTGAKVLVTGRIFKVDNDLVMVAKIFGTETSRVYGEIVKAPSNTSPVELASQLAKKIADTTVQKSDTLQAKAESPESRLERIKSSLKTEKRPVISVHIAEQHLGRPATDPAAETEISFILQQCGFTIVDSTSTIKPELIFDGEAFSELGMRRGNLVSCKARIELKLRKKENGEVLAVDRQTSVAVDSSEHIAAKAALEQAARELVERMLPKAVK